MFISLAINNYIFFIEIKNLIENLLCLLANNHPKIQNPTLPDLKNLGSYTRVLLYLPKTNIESGTNKTEN